MDKIGVLSALHYWKADQAKFSIAVYQTKGILDYVHANT